MSATMLSQTGTGHWDQDQSIQPQSQHKPTVEELQARIAELETSLKEAQENAILDPLTGLRNFRTLNQTLGDLLAQLVRYGQGFSLAFVDVDDLTALNKRLGHEGANQVLMSLAATINKSIRLADFAFRYGGDEFILVITNSTSEDAALVARRILSKFRAAGGSVSVGVTQARSDDTPETLLSRADGLAYQAKEAGKGRVVAELNQQQEQEEAN